MNFYLFSKLALKPFPVLLGCLILAEMIILDPTGRVAEPEPKLLARAGAGAGILKFRLRLQGKLK
jgi:hypothetical protein